MQRYGIGGSDAGTIAGLNKWKSAYELWLEKTGKKEGFSGNSATSWGNALEEIVAQKYSERTNNKLRKSNNMFVHKKHKWMTGNVDRLVAGSKKLVEIKTSLGKYRSDVEWGEDGSDIIPEIYFLQVQHYLAVTNYQEADLAALISGSNGAELRIYPIKRDNLIIKRLIDMEYDFWEKVQNDTPPIIKSTSDAGLRWRQDDGRTLISDSEQWSNVMQLKNIKDNIKILEKQEEEIKVKLMSFMGDKAFLVDQQGNKLCSWTTQVSNRIDTKAIKEELPDVAEKYTKISESRVFRV
jgi:putative phage-type endonuclease